MTTTILAPIWRPDKRGPTREPDKTRAVDADVSAGHSPPPRERIPALDGPKSWVAGARPAAGATNGKRSCRHSLDFCPHPVRVSPRTPDTYSGRRAFKGPPGTATGGRARPGQCHSGSGGRAGDRREEVTGRLIALVVEARRCGAATASGGAR